MSTEGQMEAFASVDMEGQAKVVYDFIVVTGNATPDEVEVFLDLDRKSVSRAFSNLRRDGYIAATDEKRASGLPRRRRQTVFVVGDDSVLYQQQQLARVRKQAAELGYRLVPLEDD